MLVARNKVLNFRNWNSCHQLVAYSSQPAVEKCPFQDKNIVANDTATKKASFICTPEEYQMAKPFSQIPGPSALNMMWNMLAPGGKYRGCGLKQLQLLISSEYGKVVKFPGIFGKEPIIMLYDADEVEKVFRNEGQWPDRKSFDFFYEFRNKIRPEIFQERGGLLQEQGKEWQDTRTKVNPVMMQPKIVKRYIGAVETITDDFISRVRLQRDDKNETPADFGNEMNKWALESIAFVALDQRLGLFLDPPNAQAQTLIQNVHDFFHMSYVMEIMPPFWKYYKTPAYKKTMAIMSSMTDIIISFIDKSIAELEKKTDHSEEDSVLEKLLKIDKHVAIIMALDMLMAGVDTTSNSILTLLYLLAKNPDKQATLRLEVMEKLPQKDSKLTIEAMKNMPYLRACMKEAQRMEAVILGTMRRLDKNVVLAGYQIPKGQYVAMPQIIMSHEEKNFKRPSEYIPERFLKSEPFPELKARQPFAFLPFGFGPRMCIGKRIADLEMETLMVKLIRNFEVEWHHPEMKYATSFLNSPTGPIRFRFNDVKE